MKKYFFFALVFTMFATQVCFAVPAVPWSVAHTLPDGTEITVYLRGDERLNWRTSEDGYTLLFNKDGYLEYAVQDQAGDLQPSGIRAKNVSERTAEEHFFLTQQTKNLRYSSSQIEALQKLRGMREDAIKGLSKNSRKVSGSVRAPLILVAFQNKSFTKTQADFEALCNNLNYTSTPNGNITGSVHDYFVASSYGQLDFQVDVFGPYTLPNNVSYYDDESGGNPRTMARQAADSAYKHGCDFSDYDIDDDGYVDAMHVIYAGYDQSAGAPAGTAIWAHAWNLSSPVNLGGKWVSRYSCSSELRNTSGSSITHIGVIAHELSHVFGLPDLYDTDYGTSGSAVDMGEWDIMAGGSWNDGGRTPAFHSAWCRAELGWTSVVTIDEPCNVTLSNPLDLEEGVAYRINTTTSNEYFLLENRQKISWDAYVPGSGLLIYHVDENYEGWDDNCGNCSPSHRGLYVKQAGCTSVNGCSNRSTDPWPQTGKTEFTDNSTPNARSWAGVNTAKPVTAITHNTSQRTVSFKFMGGVAVPPSIQTTALPNAKLNFPYSQTLVATGDPTITWALQSGSLPAGLTLSTAGVISGTPTTVGISNFTVKATNASGNVTQSLSITVNAEATIPYFEGFESTTNSDLPPGWTKENRLNNQGWVSTDDTVDYFTENIGLPRTGNRQMAASHGYADQNANPWAFSEGIQMTAGTNYTASFWFRAPGRYRYDGYVDKWLMTYDCFRVYFGKTANAASMTGTGTLLFNHGPSDSTNTWTEITATFTPSESGVYYLGFQQYTNMSHGIYIAIDDISVTVAPTQETGASVSVPTLANRTHDKITVNSAALATNTAQSIEYAIHTTNNTVATSLTWQNDTLFAGLSPNTNYYVYARSVENDNYTAGTPSVSDAFKTLAIPVPPTITTISLPNGTVDFAYSQTLTATGDATITWLPESGDLPEGLNLASNGILSGTPTVAGAFNFTVKASNNSGNQSKALNIIINKANGADVSKPTLASRTHDSITVYAVTLTNNTEQSVEYAIHTVNNAAALSLTWQTDTIFGNLAATTTYYVYARSMENSNYTVGTSSVSDTIKTPEKPGSGIQDVENTRLLQAWVQNQNLHIIGLTTGKEWCIYNLHGTLVHQGIAKKDTDLFSITSLPHGTYVIFSENKSAKIIW